MSDHPIESMMNTTMEKIKTMVDASTMIGDPITTPDGTVIIPVSKVSYGFASGGSDFVSKNAASKDLFGGGAGAAAVCGLGLAILGRRAAGVRRAAHAVERQLGKKGALALGRSVFPLRRARRAVSSIIAGFAVFHVERYLRTIIQRYYSEFCLSMQVKKVFRFPCAAALGVV